MKAPVIYISVCLLFLSKLALGAVPLVIDDQNDFLVIRGKHIDFLEDTSNKLTIQDIVSSDYKDKFSLGRNEEVSGTKNTESTWWARTTIIDKSEDKHVLFELFDFRIDYFEIYVPDQGSYKVYRGGSEFSFFQRDYLHKNFIYDFPFPKGVPVTVFIKIKADEPISFVGAVRTCHRLSQYATTEYFLLAIFYGIAVAMIFYNIFLFTALADKAYLFYVLYVLSVAVYALSQDGLGFEYLWPDYPFLNDYIAPVSVYLMVVWGLLYARSFLNTKNNLPLVDKGIIAFLILRTIIFIAWMFYPGLANIAWIDIVPFMYAYFAGMASWISGYRMARFYVLAFTLFFLGFSLYMLQHFNIVTPNPFTVYSFNIGVLLEMILLSLALADRIKMLTYEKDKAQGEIIVQFRNNEQLKDQINKELEQKVLERTKELDNFIYRSSHDIKGPLKSIIGLASVGLKDVQDIVPRKYFEHILKSSRRLDVAMDHLSHVMLLRDSELSVARLDLTKIINEIFLGLNHLPEHKRLKLHVHFSTGRHFYSDKQLVSSVLKNLIENAIKFQDLFKESFLEADIKVKSSFAYIIVKDNGVGIDKVSQEKIFDMFYKVSSDSPGSGLGLYIVKISIDKLGGNIRVKSEEGKGTIFKLAFKNFMDP